jgi:hypothetical protein
VVVDLPFTGWRSFLLPKHDIIIVFIVTGAAVISRLPCNPRPDNPDAGRRAPVETVETQSIGNPRYHRMMGGGMRGLDNLDLITIVILRTVKRKLIHTVSDGRFNP